MIGLYSVSCNPCTREESLNITSGVRFENGSIIYDGVEYIKTSWYEEEMADGEVVTLGCPCIGRVCLWKCCGSGMMYLNRTCQDVDTSEVNPFSPTVYKEREPTNITGHEHFFYMYKLSCDKYLVDSNTPGEEIYVQNVSPIEIQFSTLSSCKFFFSFSYSNFVCIMLYG